MRDFKFPLRPGWVLVLWMLFGSSWYHGAQAKTVSFCFNEWPPYATMDMGKAAGVSVEIIRAASKIIGHEAEFTELPWKRCLQMVKEGRIDAVIDAAKRDDYLQGPTSFSVYADTFWVHEDSKAKRIDDLRDGRIGLINGYEYAPRLTRRIADLGMTVELAVDDPANIRMLAFKRLDAIIGDTVGTLHFARSHRLSLRPLLPPFNTDPLYASFNRNRSALQRQYDQAFKALIEKGTVDEVYRTHVGQGFRDLIGGQ